MKFKIGDIVKVVNSLSAYYGKIGTVIGDTQYGHIKVNITGDSDYNVFYKQELELELVDNKVENDFTKLTDKDTDYEAVYKEPIYFEYVNVGQALNRLKNFEYGIVNTTSNNKETIKFLVTDELSIVPLNVVQQEFRGIDLVKIIATYVVEGVEYTIHLKSAECKKVYETYTNALEYVNKNSKK